MPLPRPGDGPSAQNATAGKNHRLWPRWQPTRPYKRRKSLGCSYEARELQAVARRRLNLDSRPITENLGGEQRADN
jgi:hypothetical protein